MDKSDMQRQLEMRHRDFEAVQKDYLETVTRLKAFQSEVDDLRSLCMTLQEKICGHRPDLHFSNGGRTSLIDQFAQLERTYQQSVDTTTWEINEIKYRNMRRMKLISSLLLMKKLTNLANQRYFATLVKIKT